MKIASANVAVLEDDQITSNCNIPDRPCPLCGASHDETISLLMKAEYRRIPDGDMAAERAYVERGLIETNDPELEAGLKHRLAVLRDEEGRRRRLAIQGGPSYQRRGAIPADVLAEIKVRTDIVDLADSLALTVLGRGPHHPFLCPVPDHNDTYPSATIYADSGRWWCHRCGSGGDTIDLVMALRGLDWRQAVEHLAHRCGIELPRRRLNEPQRGVIRVG